MSKGTVGILQAFVLASVVALIGGCDINAASPQAPEVDTVATDSQVSGTRHQLDPIRNRVWSMSQAGVFFHDASAPQNLAEVPIAGWLRASASYAHPPVFALGPRGEVLVTSNVLQTLWRIDPETLAVTEHPLALDADMDKDVGFSALVYSRRHAAYFAVSAQHGTLWRIDPLLRRGQKIALSAPLRDARGIAEARGLARQRTVRPAALCAYGQHGGWNIDFAPDQRSAYLRTASCANH